VAGQAAHLGRLPLVADADQRHAGGARERDQLGHARPVLVARHAVHLVHDERVARQRRSRPRPHPRRAEELVDGVARDGLVRVLLQRLLATRVRRVEGDELDAQLLPSPKGECPKGGRWWWGTDLAAQLGAGRLADARRSAEQGALEERAVLLA